MIRHTIRRTTAPLALACLLAAGLAAQETNGRKGTNGDAGVAVDYPVRDDDDNAALAEEIEIMRRVLIRSLLREDLENKGQDALTQFQRAAAKQSVYHVNGGAVASNGFYLPGVGVIYPITVRVKTRNVVDKPKDGDKDAWDIAKRSLDSRAGLFEEHLMRGATRTRRVIDESSVDRSVDTLLRALATHTVRMEHLPDNESIVLALELKPDRRGSGRFKTRLVLRLSKRALIESGKPGGPDARVAAREIRY